jgi:hypothetical protein
MDEIPQVDGLEKRATDLGGADYRHSRNIKQGDFEPGRPALMQLGR